MPIRFRCPKCKKVLSVKEHLAGKKAACPACKHPIVIPKPKPTAAPVAPPANVEDLAAKALAAAEEEEKKQEAPKESRTIKFNCDYCDEEVEVGFDLGGKREPCPSCKRILKVPLPEDDKPKDWREIARKGPQLALKNQPEELEGAWGTETDKGRVSRGSLEEAGAIQEAEVEPVGAGVWFQRAFITLAVFGIFVGLYYAAQFYRTKALQKHTLAKAQQAYGEVQEKMDRGWKAEMQRKIGNFHSKANKPQEARKAFLTAAYLLQETPDGKTKPPSPAEEILLSDIAVSMVQLGGNEDQVIEKIRLSWSEVQRDLERALQGIVTPDGRAFALRRVAKALHARGQDQLAEAMANRLNAGAQGDPIILAELAALMLSSGKKEEAEALVFKLPEDEESRLDLPTRLAWAAGKAYQGDFEAARKIASRKGNPIERFQAAMAVGDIALLKSDANSVQASLESALEIAKKGAIQPKAISLIMRYQLSLLSAYSEDGEEAKSRAGNLPNKELKALALLAIRRKAEDPLDTSAFPHKKSIAFAKGLVLEAESKIKKGQTSEVQALAANTDPALQPLVYVGMALGSQE